MMSSNSSPRGGSRPKPQQQDGLPVVDPQSTTSTTKETRTTSSLQKKKTPVVVVDPVVSLLSINDSPSVVAKAAANAASSLNTSAASFMMIATKPNHRSRRKNSPSWGGGGRPSARSTKQSQSIQTQQHSSSDDDRLGMKILTHLLQYSHRYQRELHAETKSFGETANLRWKLPLISTHNWNVCKAYWTWKRNSRSKKVPQNQSHNGLLCHKNHPRPTVRNTLSFGLQIEIGFMVVGNVLLVWICWKIALIVILIVRTMILPWILDWEDIVQWWGTFHAHPDSPKQDEHDDNNGSIRDLPKLSQQRIQPPSSNTRQNSSWFTKMHHIDAILYCHQRIMEAEEHSPPQKKRHRPKQQRTHEKNHKPLYNHPHFTDHEEEEDYSTTTSYTTTNTRSNQTRYRKTRSSTPSPPPQKRNHGGAVLRRTVVSSSSSPDEIVMEENRLCCETTSNDAVEVITTTGQRVIPDTLMKGESLECIMSQEEEEEDLLLTTSDLADRAEDLDWLDVGARIGLKVLHSEHIQRAMASQETKDRIFGSIDASLLNKKMNNDWNNHQDSSFNDNNASQSSSAEKTTPQRRFADRTIPSSEPRLHMSKPMHSLWTSPSAAAAATMSPPSFNDDDQLFLANDSSFSPIKFTQTFPASPCKTSSSSLRHTWSPVPGIRQRQKYNWDVSSPCRRRNSEPSVHAFRDDDAFTALSLGSRRSASSTEIRTPLETNPTTSTTPPEPPPMGTSRPQRSCYSVSPVPNSRKRRSAYASQTTESFHAVRSSGKVALFRRAPLLPGVKVALPIYPVQPGQHRPSKTTAYQMSTVKESRRIFVGEEEEDEWRMETNCLSVTVLLDKCFLRNGMFAELTFRVMDDWGPRYMPRHSKVPIGSCIATSFGVGILVGWRVEDDCHVVRSLWQNRGPGTAHAYLNRNAIHRTIEAAMGFRVQTMFGWGIVRACINIDDNYRWCRFLVEIKEANRHQGTI
jgi:hypothetical protein